MPAGWSRRTRQHGLLIVPPLAAILLGLFYVGLANAWAANGCKFPGTNPEIAYWFYSPDPAADWDEAVNYAQINWDSSTPGYGGYFVNSSSDIEIKTYDSTYSQEMDWAYYRRLCFGGWTTLEQRSRQGLLQSESGQRP